MDMPVSRSREAAAKEAQAAFLRVLSEQMETLLWTTDADLRVTSFIGGGRPSAGRRREDPIDQPVAELFQVRDPGAIPIEAHRRALAGETVAFDMTWRNGKYEVYVEPLCDAAGRILGCLGVGLNVTAVRDDRHLGLGDDPLRRLEPRPDAGGWNVGNQMDALLTLIRRYASLLLQWLGPEDTLRDPVMEIAEAGDRATAILHGRHVSKRG
jgi:hypothetical protein